MQPAPYRDLPRAPFAIRQVRVPGDSLPLAAARNAAATAAQGDGLIFLDTDCIPGPTLVATYAGAMGTDRCLMGETRYLGQDDAHGRPDFAALWRASHRHPARDFPQVSTRLSDPLEFWSLSFAMTAATFRTLGGFDTRFIGYGGEDTDFARRMEQHDVALIWTPDARAVHQWHRVQKPPIAHFDDIIRNARLFHRLHGCWCMEYWLDQFEGLGLIRRTSLAIEVLRPPTSAEADAARCDGAVRFS